MNWRDICSIGASMNSLEEVFLVSDLNKLQVTFISGFLFIGSVFYKTTYVPTSYRKYSFFFIYKQKAEIL